MNYNEFYIGFDWGEGTTDSHGDTYAKGCFDKERNIRGKFIIKDHNGNPIKNTPTKKIEDCFDIENKSWFVLAIDKKTGDKLKLIFASGTFEAEYRKANAHLIEFEK